MCTLCIRSQEKDRLMYDAHTSGHRCAWCTNVGLNALLAPTPLLVFCVTASLCTQSARYLGLSLRVPVVFLCLPPGTVMSLALVLEWQKNGHVLAFWTVRKLAKPVFSKSNHLTLTVRAVELCPIIRYKRFGSDHDAGSRMNVHDGAYSRFWCLQLRE